MTLTAIYNEMTGFVDKSRVVEVVYFNFSKVFSPVTHSTLTAKRMRC